MHQLNTFEAVASELGHDAPVLHAVVATHRCLPRDPVEMSAAAAMPRTAAVAAAATVRAASTNEDCTPAAAPDEEEPLTVEEELAQLDRRMSAWRAERLAALPVPSSARPASRAAQVEAAMELRIHRKRIEEQDRAQQRLERLLDSLGPRIEHQLDLVARAQGSSNSHAASPSAPPASTSGAPAAVAGPAVASRTVTLPPERARVLCEQEHFVTAQQVALAERDERQGLQQRMWHAHRLTHLAEDERAFRAAIVDSEGVWRARIDEDAQDAAEEDEA